MVSPLDGYVLVGKEHENEVIIRPTDEAMEGYEIVISHVKPSQFVNDIDKDEEEYGIEVESGTIIGNVRRSILQRMYPVYTES